MKCIQCANFEITGSPLAKSGTAKCATKPFWWFGGFRERNCERYEAADEQEMAARRIQWAERKESK